MSSGDFFGPALPPGFGTHSDKGSQNKSQEQSDKKKRKRSKSSESPENSQSDTSQSSSDSESSDDSQCSSKKHSQPEATSVVDDFVRPSLPPQCMGPALPLQVMGPALPPGFTSDGQDMSSGNFIGPVIPVSLLSTLKSDDYGDNDGDLVGPLPDSASERNLHSALDELEARAQHMKDKLLGKDVPDQSSLVMKREEWMTELPPEMSKNFGVTARKFSTKSSTSADKDRSVWTDTPADRARKEQQLLDGTLETEAVIAPAAASIDSFQVAADAAYKEQVDKYNKLARPKSLLEMHSEKLHHKSHHHSKKKKKKNKKDGKEKKKKKKHHLKDSDDEESDKKNKSKEKKEERRPFDREKDLQVTRFDDAQRKAVIKRSQELGGRFGHGSFQFL